MSKSVLLTSCARIPRKAFIANEGTIVFVARVESVHLIVGLLTECDTIWAVVILQANSRSVIPIAGVISCLIAVLAHAKHSAIFPVIVVETINSEAHLNSDSPIRVDLYSSGTCAHVKVAINENISQMICSV